MPVVSNTLAVRVPVKEWGAEERHEEGLGAGKMASERRKETVSTPPYLSS